MDEWEADVLRRINKGRGREEQRSMRAPANKERLVFVFTGVGAVRARFQR